MYNALYKVMHHANCDMNYNALYNVMCNVYCD